uniref:Glycosyl transferase CAP10 domain-containing protein n=1 Tax=Amphora coffeiformis TaxID=265554 RepID=A0A7S3L8V7_9STRA
MEQDDRNPDEDVDLIEERRFKSFAPIVSFYAAAPDRFTDIPWPSSEDWEAACGLVFPHTFKHTKKGGEVEIEGNPRDLFTEANFRKFERAWEENRVATAFFRGTATGGGTTIDNNQRLKVAQCSHDWKDDPVKGGDEPFLDGAIVGWNLRDKKIAQGPMTFLRKKNFGFTAGKHHFTPIYEQSKYKYLVYVDGHCAACRYGFMMRLGSVIIKVLPRQVADRMWYFPILKPLEDHVPVKEDLSDLEEKIQWCRDNDEKCKKIGQNAMAFYEKYVSRKPLLDYVQMACRHIAKRQVDAPAFWQPPPPEEKPPSLTKPDGMCFEDHATHTSRYCSRCQEEVDKEEEEKKLKEEEEKKARQNKGSRKKNLKERMRKKAKTS